MAFAWWSEIMSIFPHTLDVWITPFEKYISKMEYFYFWYQVVWIIHIFWIVTLCWICGLQVFSQYVLCLFILLIISPLSVIDRTSSRKLIRNFSFALQKLFNVIPPIFCFCCLYFWCHSQNNYCRDWHKEDFFLYSF